MSKVSIRFVAWIGLLLLIMLLGLYAISVVFPPHPFPQTPWYEGQVTFGTTPEVPWGILVSTYVFFVVAGTGMCLITSFGHVFGVTRYKLIGKRGVFLAIITLIVGFMAIGVELGHPERLMIYFLLSPNFSSPIWWMGFLYMLYLVFLISEFILLIREDTAKKGQKSIFYRILALGSTEISEEEKERDHRLAHIAGIAAIILGISATSTVGAVFALLKAKPLWYGPYTPTYFLLSAFVSGAAILTLTIIAVHWSTKEKMGSKVEELVIELGKLLALFLGVSIVFITWKTIASLYGSIPGEYETMQLLLRGDYKINFWIFEVLIGTLIPFFILLNRRTRTVTGVFTASLLTLVGMFVIRYDFVVAGQTVPVFEVIKHGVYSPSHVEMFVVIGLFAFYAFLYTLGEKLFTLGEE